MSVIRAFIALDLPPEVQENLAQVSAQLKEQLGEKSVRWVPVENIHLTLKFLGDVSVNNLGVLKEIIASEAAQAKPMEFSVGRLGAFPKIRRPRVIWVGIEAPPELMALQRSIEARTTRVGYPPDEREFSPHLTLGRVSRTASPKDVSKIGEVLNASSVGFLGAVRVREIHLLKSDLQPSGAVYSKMFTTPIGE
ncbi:MAG TPA: RNA 2',3'-cyclic phosphodiesterase [Chloroflexi bacterium]|nr:RNA 2',3'-cyclic phosphodiesterase [Chloroflexota bacterium]HBY08642.1 RNA 2',3'-cyclic phosphodiesterase [Chloroflexota bacterium]